MTTLRLALLLALAALSGCTYSVEVRNATPDAVNVRLIQLDPLQPDWILAYARVDAGERVRLKESRVAFEKVVLEANIADLDDNPVRTNVGAGTRVYRIEPGPTADQPIIFVVDSTPWTPEQNHLKVVESRPPGEAGKSR